jgi:hypothetical protein
MGILHDIQTPLFRAFSKERYAIDFSGGKFRLRALSEYRSIEDTSRQDAAEGYGHYKDRYGHDWNFEFGGRIYLLCLARPEVDKDYLRERMGPYIVKINDSAELAHDIERSLHAKGVETFNGVHAGAVQYTKGHTVIKELDPMRRAFLSVMQKPESYSSEHEYRFFTILNEDERIPAREFIDVDVGVPLRYVQVME